MPAVNVQCCWCGAPASAEAGTQVSGVRCACGHNPFVSREYCDCPGCARLQGSGPWTLWAAKGESDPLGCQGVFSDCDKAIDIGDDLIDVGGYFQAVVRDVNLQTVYSHRARGKEAR